MQSARQHLPIAGGITAALVAYQTRDAAGQRQLDQDMPHAVLVMLVVTSIVGLILTQRYAPKLLPRTGS